MEVGKLAVGNRRGKRAYKLGRWIDGDRKGVATGGWEWNWDWQKLNPRYGAK